jgi:hypothetical protein
MRASLRLATVSIAIVIARASIASATPIAVATIQWDVCPNDLVRDCASSLAVLSVTDLWDDPGSDPTIVGSLTLTGGASAESLQTLDPLTLASPFFQTLPLSNPTAVRASLSFSFNGSLRTVSGDLNLADLVFVDSVFDPELQYLSATAFLQFDPDTPPLSQVPEPSSITLVTLGLGLLARRVNRSRRKSISP